MNNKETVEGHLYKEVFKDSPYETISSTSTIYKGNSTKEGSNPKAIAKRRKRNKNKKTHRNAH